jgi:hypothetical protein
MAPVARRGDDIAVQRCPPIGARTRIGLGSRYASALGGSTAPRDQREPAGVERLTARNKITWERFEFDISLLSSAVYQRGDRHGPAEAVQRIVSGPFSSGAANADSCIRASKIAFLMVQECRCMSTNDETMGFTTHATGTW